MILDSSVIVAYFNEGDTQFLKARELMDKLPEWLIFQPILFETITALHIRAGKKVAKDALHYLREDPKTKLLGVDQRDFAKALEHFELQSGSLMLFDWLLFAASKRTGVMVKTFDRKLNRLIYDDGADDGTRTHNPRDHNPML